MSDDSSKPTSAPDGATTTPDGDVETLKQQLAAERAARERAEADAKANRERFEQEKLERDKRIEVARRKAEQDGEFEKLANDYKAQLEQSTARIAELEAIKTQHDALVQQKRDELIAQLPEPERDGWKDAPLDMIARAVKLAQTSTTQIPATHSGRAGAAGGGVRKWNDMTGPEQIEYAATHSQADVNRLIAESLGRA